MNNKRVSNSVAWGTRVAPSTARSVRAFAKKYKMPISTITNSALKIFIVDAANIAENTQGKSFEITPLTNAAKKHKKEVEARVVTSKIHEKFIMNGLTKVKKT